MSSKKIVRLKTPTRLREDIKNMKVIQVVHPRFADLQTVIKDQHHEESGYLQRTLIVQINKLYHQIETIKRELERERRINEELKEVKTNLKEKVETLQQKYEQSRQMYELQKNNHHQLRHFYEKRQKQWQTIVMQHKRMLDEHFYQHYTYHNYGNQHQLSNQITAKRQDKRFHAKNHEYQQQILHQSQKRQIRKLKRLSKQNLVEPQIVHYYGEISRLYEQQKAFANRGLHKHISISNRLSKCTSSRNPESDDLLDRIMRKTFYHFRQRGITIIQIKNNQEMMKLKHAKTSTKERLPKTLKKLQFQFENERQLQFFCGCVEQAVFLQSNSLRGDFVFNFIIQRLINIEQMATNSNSDIERQEPTTFDIEDNEMYENEQVLQLAQIGRLSQQNLDLLLNSVIKASKIDKHRRQEQGEYIQKIRYSESQIQNVSNIIFGGKFFIQGGSKYMNNEDPPTVDLTMR